jgi:glycosyltransferase involved in cell wall biosynthesis
VLTLHGRLDIPEIAPLYGEYSEVPLVSISDAQRIHMPEANWLATVYHGLPPDLYTGVPLRIAAKVDKVDREYFERTIRPLLDHPLVDFIGEVDERQKNVLLGNALALLFPIDWPEPFGLIMIESLACGTPVIARRRGSVPEILKNQHTGLLCETEDEMVDAVRRVARLDRALCRQEFERRFTACMMTQRYLQVYEKAVATRTFPKHKDSGALVPVSNTLKVGVSNRVL